MCYGSGCKFEQSYTGECRLVNRQEITNIYGYDTCFIGGAFLDPDEYRTYKRLEPELEKITRQVLDGHRF